MALSRLDQSSSAESGLKAPIQRQTADRLLSGLPSALSNVSSARLIALMMAIGCGEKDTGTEPDTGTDDTGEVIVDSQDLDGDGFYVGADATGELDCDDQNNTIYPGADELCDGVDNNCDGQTDESGAVDGGPWYVDGDGDGYGGEASDSTDCDAPSGHVGNAEDCNDSDEQVHPKATEICDDVDNNCNDFVDEDESQQFTWYLDNDGDGYGDSGQSQLSCDQPDNHVDNDGDCDDSDEEISPDVVEDYCDGVDNNCDGTADEDCNAWATYVGTENYYDEEVGCDVYWDVTGTANTTALEECDGCEWAMDMTLTYDAVNSTDTKGLCSLYGIDSDRTGIYAYYSDCGDGVACLAVGDKGEDGTSPLDFDYTLTVETYDSTTGGLEYSETSAYGSIESGSGTLSN